MRSVRLELVSLLAAFGLAAPALASANPAPGNLGVVVSGGDVQVTWVAPDPMSGNTTVRLLRRLNSPPSGPDDAGAEMLHAGAATEFTHPIVDLVPDIAGSPHVYHYAVFGCDPSGITCEAVGSHASLAPTLVECLRGGGYTIYWRHTDADVCTDHFELGTAANATVPDWWKSCDPVCATATARQMNAAGVQRAIFIGDQIQLLELPIGRVITSEFCRCVHTAELMDFGIPLEPDPGITFFVYDESNRCSHCYDQISQVPAVGTNTAIVAHQVSFCPELNTLAMGECAVFKPRVIGDPALITRLTWDSWGVLTTDVTPRGTLLAGVTLEAPHETAAGVRIRFGFASEDPGQARLEVFDVRGRRLWFTPVESRGPGAYERIWDRRDQQGSEIARGIYFVRLIAGQTVLTRKASVLRH